MGAAALSGAGRCLSAPSRVDHFVPVEKKLSAERKRMLHARGARQPYRAEQLETIGMPCGGICAGQLYVRGDGTLGHWWIANNAYNTGYGKNFQVHTPTGVFPQAYTTFRPPSHVEQGFAIRVQPVGGEPIVRRLSRDDFDDIRFFGEYPVATIEYGTKEQAALPVKIHSEVFSPFIPLNARDSAMPVTLFRFTVANPSRGSVDVSIGGWLQNAVLLDLAGRTRADLRNRVVRDDDLTCVRMDAVEAGESEDVVRRETIFASFENGSYDGWTVAGEAFGKRPATGTFGKQQPISGWKGRFFVNTFHGGSDKDRGKLTSRTFTIAERYIAFLIGGGDHAGKTCLNLVVDGKVVRTAVGARREKLSRDHWDVADLKGRKAHLEIVDNETGPWGHVNVDDILFTNLPPVKQEAFSKDHPYNGEMALASLDAKSVAGAAWTAKGAFLEELLSGKPRGQAGASGPLGEELCGTVTSSVRVAGEASETLTFLVTWCFPNRHQDNVGTPWGTAVGGKAVVGNRYAKRFRTAVDVARYVAKDFDRLMGETFAFRDAYFDTTLPYWFAQRLAMPLANLATETCQWWANGRFWAWEGVGCCHGTCAHVWNYVQALGRVFPELARSVRTMQDYGEALETSTGEIAHRGIRPGARRTRTFLDAQAGTVLKAYREHLVSADDAFLRRNWPKIKLSLDWLVGQDGDGDGLIEGTQPNTYDIAFVKANTFVGALYLAALRAGQEMARRMEEGDYARKLGAIAERGRAGSLKRLWNGEYFVQDVPLKGMPRHQYADGCLSDQLFGQSWAHQVGLGHLYSAEHERTALESIWRYNWAPDVGPQSKAHPPERIYARPGESGLLLCTWPKSRHPGNHAVRYRDEVWTGIEYQVAAHMLYEGMVTEALAIVRAIHDRYDGEKHNPWNEIECGDHYARAMASWGCLLGVSGFTYDGPAGRIGFAPRMTPEDFRCFFTAAQGWGQLSQVRTGGRQKQSIELRYGTLRVTSLVFEAAPGAKVSKVDVRIAGRAIPATHRRSGSRVEISLSQECTIRKGESIVVTMA